jgi:uncharacterized membrane protein HdeD (DUF308 family)
MQMRSFTGAPTEPLPTTSRWGLALRGIAAIIFGLLVWTWPGMVLHVLVVMFGIFAITGGVFAILAGVRATTSRNRWLLIAEGVLSVLAGIVALGWPAITAVALLFLIALWAIVTGVVEIIGAFRTGGAGAIEWLLILSGVISIIFGILLFVWPHLGLLALVWLIGIYAVIYGVMMLIRAFSGEAPKQPYAPTGGIPTP